MIELDLFKTKLLGYLKEYAPERINETEWIEELSDACYDTMNRNIKYGIKRYEAQNMAISEMLASVPESFYMRLNALYEEKYNSDTNTEGLPLFPNQKRQATIISLMKIWPDKTIERTNNECIKIIEALIGENSHYVI